MGAQAQIVAHSLRNLTQNTSALERNLPLLWIRDTGVWFGGYPSRIKKLLSDFMIHLKLKHCYFMLITALITDLFHSFSTPQYIIRASIDIWMPHLAAMQCSSWVEVTVWGFRTLYCSYTEVVLLHMHCLTFINASQKVKETVISLQVTCYSPRQSPFLFWGCCRHKPKKTQARTKAGCHLSGLLSGLRLGPPQNPSFWMGERWIQWVDC